MSLTADPCPFCGGNAGTKNVRDGCEVYCHCGASMVRFHGPGGDTIGKAITAWNERAAREEARPSPEGWVLVPREPTEAMTAAAVESLGLPWREIQRTLDAYRAMVAASPPPPGESVEDSRSAPKESSDA